MSAPQSDRRLCNRVHAVAAALHDGVGTVAKRILSSAGIVREG